MFYIKLALFLAVGLISIPPTLQYLRWMRSLNSGAAGVAADYQVLRVRRHILVELILFALIPLMATLMARGIGIQATRSVIRCVAGSKPKAFGYHGRLSRSIPMKLEETCFLPAHELVRHIRARELSAVEVMDAHIAQIERINPEVNAVVTFLPELGRKGARAVDAALARGDDPGPLAGLPVAHKDLVTTRGIRTTFGSPIFKDFVPDADAIIVERLRKAGAITIGKTNTPEFGAGSQTFNPVFGATRNPYDLAKTCGGSSGGAAAALACGLLPIADGSDMGGSLRNPASFCNVVGLRPSAGRVPHWPSVSGWFHMAVVGPMARTVQDVALMLSAIAGPDARAPISLQDPGSMFSRPLARDFKGARIAWSADLGGLPVEPEVSADHGCPARDLRKHGLHRRGCDAGSARRG